MKNLLFIFTLFITAGVAVHAQTPKPCKVNVAGGKYKVTFADREVTKEGQPFLHMAVEFGKDKFNEEYLVKIAQRIRETYCHENSISAYFVDKAIKKLYLSDVVPSPIFPLGTKCLYSLDRQKGTEKIGFYDDYGNRTGEPDIELSKQPETASK